MRLTSPQQHETRGSIFSGVRVKTLSAIFAVVSAGSVGLSQPASTDMVIQPATSVGGAGSGYLADPQPIRTSPSAGNRVQMLSGTTRAVINCAYPIKPGCFSWTPLNVSTGALQSQIEGAGAFKTNIQNIDLFQDDQGGWHAAVTIGVNTRQRQQQHQPHWTVVAHAHPVGATSSERAPLEWEADTVLAGSFSKPAPGNYDGKFFEDGGRLFLLYVDTIAPRPALRNAVFLQPMASFTRVAASKRVMLLRPGSRDGDLTSETYADTQAKLVEAPYLSKVGDKYALVYSTGGYLTAGYKAGVAWSDALMPAGGRTYRKVLMPDAGGVWGRPGAHEVDYLIQSEKPRWPHFTGTQVIGPGVAAAVQGPGGAWWLYFNGYAPNDMRRPDGQVAADHRRPYYLRLRAEIPAGKSVESASDEELGAWLQPDQPHHQ